MINVNSVSITYGSKVAVNAFSYFFDTGVTAIIGPNGAGKSTFLKAVAGLNPVDHGSIEIFGHDATTSAGRLAAQQHIGYLAQHPDFPNDFTVGEMLEYSAWLNGLGPSEAGAALARASSRFGVGVFWDKPIGKLSGGMRQRAFLCQSLLLDPEILLLDEPTSAIDSVKRGEFRAQIAELAQERAVILTTHVVEDVTAIADNVVVMVEGSIVFTGNAHELFDFGIAESRRTAEHPIEAAMRILSNEQGVGAW